MEKVKQEAMISLDVNIGVKVQRAAVEKCSTSVLFTFQWVIRQFNFPF